jgi:hypothetical protein
LKRRTLAGRRRRARIRIVGALIGCCAVLSGRSLSRADESSAPGAANASNITFDCTGRESGGRSLPSFASGGQAKFTVSATFGEGATVALIDPETGAVLKPLYDAETTVGRLRFGDGEETTVVWTRMSGADGALMGAAIMSDGDVLALTIDPAPQGAAQRPFVLFAAASANLVRGTCGAATSR